MSNLIFVVGSLGMGGAEKSLINLVNEISNDKKINITILAYKKNGFYDNKLPRNVNIKELAYEEHMFFENLKVSSRYYLKNLKFKFFIYRILFSIISKFNGSERIKLSILKKLFTKHQEVYDVAISYTGTENLYLMLETIKANKYFTRVATDYSRLSKFYNLDINYFNNLDGIMAVSETISKSILKIHPSLSKKIFVFESLVPVNEIKKKSIGHFPYHDNEFVIVTVARLNNVKGIDLAIEAGNILKKKGLKFKWYILGEGNQRGELENLISKYNLENYIILMGNVDNPYPYIKSCYVYVQPSRFEGKSNSVNEAKVLEVPIIITNYPSSKDQIINNYNGLIVEISSESIAEGIELLILDKNLRNKLINNSKNNKFDNEKSLEIFYKNLLAKGV